MEQRYGTDPSNRYGTEVWNGGMERVWSRTLFRTLYFDLHPYEHLERTNHECDHTKIIQAIIHNSHDDSITIAVACSLYDSYHPKTTRMPRMPE